MAPPLGKSWDTWIRTTIDGFKVRCSAIELYPNNGFILPCFKEIKSKNDKKVEKEKKIKIMVSIDHRDLIVYAQTGNFINSVLPGLLIINDKREFAQFSAKIIIGKSTANPFVNALFCRYGIIGL